MYERFIDTNKTEEVKDNHIFYIDNHETKLTSLDQQRSNS